MVNHRLFAKIIVLVLFFTIFVPSAYALQQVAGPLSLTVLVGGTNSTTWTLLNDKNEEVIVNIETSENIANLLQFSSSVKIKPGEFYNVEVKAVIPENYPTGTVDGFLYANEVTEAAAQGTQLIIRVGKSISLSIVQPRQILDITGFVSLAIIILVGFFFILKRKRR